MRQPRKIILLVVFCLVVAAVVGRFAARSAAKNYGRNFELSMRLVGSSAFADTEKLHAYLKSPDMASLQNRVRALAFLGGSYSEEIDELQRGMIYLSGQMGLAPEKRFENPPPLKHLSMTSDDHSDVGIGNAAVSLIVSYQSHF